MIFRFSDYVLDIDVDRTREFYAREDIETTSEKCTCQGCQNYDKAILAASDTVVGFLRSLGIDPRKPTEVFNTTGMLEEDGTIPYNGWLHICGTIVEGPDTVTERVTEDGVRCLSYRWDLAYRPDPAYPFELLPTREIDLIPENFPAPVLQMEINTRLPWVLSEPYKN